jgi:hypothetical protein
MSGLLLAGVYPVVVGPEEARSWNKVHPGVPQSTLQMVFGLWSEGIALGASIAALGALVGSTKNYWRRVALIFFWLEVLGASLVLVLLLVQWLFLH